MNHFRTFKLTTPVHLAFNALVPGFFFYHSALALGLISPVLRGYFSPVTLLFLPVLITIYQYKIRMSGWFLTKVDIAFLGYLLYLLCIVIIQFITGANQFVLSNHLFSFSHLLIVFIIFRLADFNAIRFRRISLIFLLAMTVIVLDFSAEGLFSLTNMVHDDTESLASYQQFARSYLWTFIVVIPFLKSWALRGLMSAIALAALFLNGARSEFGALILIIMLTSIFSTQQYKHRFFLLASIFILAPFLLYNMDSIIKILPNNRTLELLHYSDSSSWDARKVFFDRAVETIMAHPLLGDFGSYADFGGSAGSYAHNIFSAWVDLGFFGFAYLLCMIAWPMLMLSRRMLSKRVSGELMLTFSLMCITLFYLFTSKVFTDLTVAAAIGRYAYYKNLSSRKAFDAGGWRNGEWWPAGSNSDVFRPQYGVYSGTMVVRAASEWDKAS